MSSRFFCSMKKKIFFSTIENQVFSKYRIFKSEPDEFFDTSLDR